METKKLTCCDIMIGDWVSIDNKPHKLTGIQICDGIMCVQTDYTDTYYSIENYAPISLTAEILEKSGFVKHRDIFYRFAVHIDEFNGFWFTLGSDFDGVFCLQSNRFVRFAYVHELQHALRLCGINDKEIVL